MEMIYVKIWKVLLRFLVENELTLVSLLFFLISPLISLNLVLIASAKFDYQHGTWTGCQWQSGSKLLIMLLINVSKKR